MANPCFTAIDVGRVGMTLALTVASMFLGRRQGFHAAGTVRWNVLMTAPNLGASASMCLVLRQGQTEKKYKTDRKCSNQLLHWFTFLELKLFTVCLRDGHRPMLDVWH